MRNRNFLQFQPINFQYKQHEYAPISSINRQPYPIMVNSVGNLNTNRYKWKKSLANIINDNNKNIIADNTGK